MEAELEKTLARSEHISTPPNARVNAILRDHRGFLWFGTTRGLCKYDGYQVRVFVNGASANARRAAVTAIIEIPGDASKFLLLGTLEGLWAFDLQTEEFTKFLPEAEFSDKRISALARDPDGTLWVGTGSHGLFTCDSTLQQYSTENGLKSNAINCLLVDPSGVVWVGTHGGGLQALERRSAQLVHYGKGDPSRGLRSDIVTALCEVNDQDLWIGTTEGLDVLDRRTGKLRRLDLPSRLTHTVHAILPDPVGRVWVGASDLGLLFYAHGAFSRIPFSDQGSLLGSLGLERQNTTLNVDPVSSDSTTVLLWVGTRNGVRKYLLSQNPFTNHIRNRNGLQLDRGAVLSLLEDRNEMLWVGLWGGGLEGLRYEQGRYRRVYHFEHDPANPSSLPMNTVNAICEDHQRRLWVGTPLGLAVLDRQRKRMTVIRPIAGDSSTLVGANIDDVLEDRSGTIWVATHSGLSRLVSVQPPRFKNYLHDPADAHPYGENRVSFLHEDRRGNLWAGTFGRGLNRYNGDGTFTRYLHPGDSSGFYENLVHSFTEDQDGVFWLSTGARLVSFEPEKGAWKTYRIEELHDAHIHGISIDRNRKVWLSTAAGLAKFDPVTGIFIRYDHRWGLAVYDLFSGFAHTSRGTLVVGGQDGFSEFSPEELGRTRGAPEIAITGVAVFDKPLSSSRLSSGKIELAHDQNFLTISFAALDYADPLSNGFAYRMDGVEKDWIQASSRNYVTYANLEPGTYVFRVKGYNSQRVWNEEGTFIAIAIAPPFWMTWWFRILVAILVLSAIYAAYRYRLRKLLEVERLRLRIADDLHDDVGSNLSSISLGSELVLRQSKLDEEARKLIGEIRENAARTAETMRDIVWIINPKNDQVEDLILRMKDAAAHLLRGVEHSFHVPEASLPRIADLTIRRNIFLIYKEALNNIARHAKATRVEISLTYSHKRFMLSVRDNGVGFDPAVARKGNGLAGFQRRASAIGAELEVQSAPGKGTTVRVSVPIP